MSKKVKKFGWGGAISNNTALVAPTKTSLGWGKPAPVANQPVRGPLPQATNPVRPIGGQARPPATGGLPAPGIGGRPPIGGQARPPAGNPAMMKKGGSVKSSASKRADGIATKGKTRGKIV